MAEVGDMLEAWTTEALWQRNKDVCRALDPLNEEAAALGAEIYRRIMDGTAVFDEGGQLVARAALESEG